MPLSENPRRAFAANSPTQMAMQAAPKEDACHATCVSPISCSRLMTKTVTAIRRNSAAGAKGSNAITCVQHDPL